MRNRAKQFDCCGVSYIHFWEDWEESLALVECHLCGNTITLFCEDDVTLNALGFYEEKAWSK